MDNHWAVTTSSGRRVSLLCEENSDYAISPYAGPSSSLTPPPSPDYRRPYPPFRTDSISSACSSTSSLATVSSQGLYSPQTPPNMSLPSLEKLLPVPETVIFNKYGPELGSPVLTSGTAMSVDGSLSPTSTHATTASSPPSPKTTVAAPAVKRSSRRYTCQCGKSFTTSGHLARHTRIHTGEKNYVCPEAGCAARFSRQDNCMQHYRTHQSGSGSKRAARKRRISADAASAQRSTEPAVSETVMRQPPSIPPSAAAMSAPLSASQLLPLEHASHCYSTQYISPNYFEAFGSDGGLAALANVACSGYS
ncbi:hypothetical protein FN846DRAFT_945248 [Sphaerosporella brunnea]|uniref:C2H2 type master regulator of conidiophore development brlA n=1 Tax=Sphaerosporella brunnea TaxID=1250544 RepID=A0A5J5EZF8_9PEZI|nr:hypothetical protein FN846DRAFT_945248 [Sphaerosporella brunnea]